MKKLLQFVTISLFLLACTNDISESNTAKNVNSTNDYTGVYYIPPPSGPGTGVCETYLIVINNKLIVEETCGGHDDYGRTETTERLFETNFNSNFKYRVSDYMNTNLGTSFGCDYFEFKDSKLFLYDSELNIVRDWFCLSGSAASLKGLSDKEIHEKDECDCVFFKASSEVSENHMNSNKEGEIQRPQSKEERIAEIKEWYSEIQGLGMINCDLKKRVKYDRLNSTTMESPFEQIVKTCILDDNYKLIRGEFSGYEWIDNINIYIKRGKIFFVYIEGAAESSSWEYRYYCDNEETVIKILEKEGDMSEESNEGNKEIPVDPTKLKIHDKINNYLNDIEYVISDG